MGSMSAADPAFALGRTLTHWGGAATSDGGAFRWKHMQKRKNWIPLGGGIRQQRPPDPPLHVFLFVCLFFFFFFFCDRRSEKFQLM